MAGRGGARPGAGRKPKSERFASQIAVAEQRIADKLPALVDAMLELAMGVQVVEVDEEGEERTYRKPPDFKALSYLKDRIMGRPTVAIEQEISGPGGGPINVSTPARKKAEEELAEWRRQQTGTLSNMLSVAPTAPTSPTTTE